MKQNVQIVVFLLLSVLNFVAAFGGSEEKFIKRYAMMKVYESCFGSQVLNEIRKEMKEAAQKCSGVQSHFDGSSTSADQDQSETETASSGEAEIPPPLKKPVDFSKLEEAIMNIGKPPTAFGVQKTGSGNSNFQQSAAVGYYPMYYPPPVPFAPSYPYHAYYPGYFQSPAPAGSAAFQSFYRSGLRAGKITNFNSNRSRKQADTKPQIDFGAFQYNSKIRNISCIMQELGYLDEHLEPNYARMTERINRLYIAEELKRDMLDGVKFCRQFSQCLPETRKDSSQLSKELLRPMFFFRCYKHKKLESCIMKDIRDRFSQSSAELNNEVRRSFRNSDIAGTIFESAFVPGVDDYESLL